MALAWRPLQLCNLIALEIGRQLRRHDGSWSIEINAGETKTGEPVSVPFPDVLVPALETYLGHRRPQLASPGRIAGSQAPGLTEQGRGISASHAHLHVTRRHTREAFGRPVNLHLFRDAAAATVAIARPEQVRIIGCLLGHCTIGTARSTTTRPGTPRPHRLGTGCSRISSGNERWIVRDGVLSGKVGHTRRHKLRLKGVVYDTIRYDTILYSKNIALNGQPRVT